MSILVLAVPILLLAQQPPIPTGPSQSPPVQQVHAAAEAIPTDTLSLHQALRRALISNPTLRAAQYGVEAHVADERQAARWPNPVLEADVAEFGGRDELAGLQAAEIGAALAQTLPLGGDVQAHRQVAARERLRAEQQRLSTRLDLTRAVTQAFWHTLATQHERKLAAEQWALAQRLAATVEDRVEAGKVSPLEATRAAIDRSAARVALEQAEQAARAARVQLSRWWGAITPAFDGVRAEWPAPDTLPPLSVLAAEIPHTPDLIGAEAEIGLRQAERHRVKAERIPDPTVRAGVQRFRAIGEVGIQVGLSLPLPLFDRKRGALDAAQARVQQAEANAEAVLVEVQVQLSNQYYALHAAASAVHILDAEVVPAAADVYEATLEGYREGKFDLLTLIDAQRTLFEVSRQQVAARLHYAHQRAEVERLIGRSLDTQPTHGASQ